MTKVARMNRWMPLGVTLLLVAMFAGAAVVLSLRWRGDLHAGLLQREAEALDTAVLLLHETTPVGQRFADYGVGDGTRDLFTAVLKSTALKGFVMARCFDRDGRLLESWPFAADARLPDTALRERAVHDGAIAKFHPAAPLEYYLGATLAARVAAASAPLLEVLVPLRATKGGPVLGVAHYWMDGAPVAAKFAAVDRGLLWQVGLIVALGSAGIALVAGWTLRRLAATNRVLKRQGEDLERANRELVLAAKTSAIGAISAHLIHGLKNPLDGLEGFVTDTTSQGGAPDGVAWREAAETTRRLRTLVNDVVAVLRDEAAGAGCQVGLRDVVNDVLHKFACDAERNGVQLTAIAQPPDITLDTRVAHLAGLVLANLLGNALEAAPRGSAVTFAAGCSSGEIEFKIEDHGPGLPAAVRKHLFRPLRSTKPGGSGIGLAISHQLARHVGGRLELVRSSDEGTVFRFVVPQG